jgi:formylglycine-generating enzyme required for sulfatase activity
VERMKPLSEGLGSPTLTKAIKTLEDNAHLCPLLATSSGQKWLQDEKFREMQQEASEATRGDEKRKTLPQTNKEPIRELLDGMKRIQGGDFQMGSKQSEREQPIHTVQLEGFDLGATPVTQAQYEAIMGTNPSGFKGSNRPAENVSWDEAVEFCEKLSAETGEAFSLPTEAQWEYACRAGSPAAWCFGDDESKLDDYAWYSGNSAGETHPVREKRPNDWGLYDMHGNVWEWCQDWGGNYPRKGSTESNPKGPSTGSCRVGRGGSWRGAPEDCRSALRGWYAPSGRSSNLGFRVARSSVRRVDAQ